MGFLVGDGPLNWNSGGTDNNKPKFSKT